MTCICDMFYRSTCQSKVPWMVIITLTTINTFADEFVGGENGLVAKIREYNYITVFKQFLCFILEIKRDVNPV